MTISASSKAPSKSAMPKKACQDWRPHRAHVRNVKWPTYPYRQAVVCQGVENDDDSM